MDVSFCCVFLFAWLVASKFSLMLAFAVFFPFTWLVVSMFSLMLAFAVVFSLHDLLLASSHGCWLLLCFSSLHGLLLVTLCLIYSPICEIFMCGFYTTFINRCGRSDLSGTTTCLTTSVPAVKGKLLLIIFYSKTFSFFTQVLWS